VKLVYEEFFCPECESIRYLKLGNVCADCKDKRVLENLSQSRKAHNILNEQICVH